MRVIECRMAAQFGIVITNRNRAEPLGNCLLSIAAQVSAPAWVVISDFGSQPESAKRLRQIADDFEVSYLRVEDTGPWRQALAFNTALRAMPAVSHVVQLDADMILHPYLLKFCEAILQQREAVACVTSYAPPGASATYDGSLRSYRELLGRSKTGIASALGGCMVFPRAWLWRRRGFDESFVGWGFEDADIWWRAQQELDCYCEPSGSLLIHQAHARQAGASTQAGNPNWKKFLQRKEGRARGVNARSFGRGAVSEKVIRACIRRVEMDDECGPPWRRSAAPRRAGGGRLRAYYGPRSAVVDSLEAELEFSGGASQTESFRVSTILALRDVGLEFARETIKSLGEQSSSRDELLLVDRGSDAAHVRGYQAMSREIPSMRYLRCDTNGMNVGTAINAGLRAASQSISHVLIVRDGVLAHPQLLETCCRMQTRNECFVYGCCHAVPALWSETGKPEGLPWDVWGSIAYVDEGCVMHWYFGARDWLLNAGLFDERLGVDEMDGEAVARARRSRAMQTVQFPLDWPVVLNLEGADTARLRPENRSIEHRLIKSG